MPVLEASPSVLPVVLALASAALWGLSDFGGGLLGRRAPIMGVLLATQGVGFLIATAGVVVWGEPMLVGKDLWLAIAAAGLAAVGVGSLYRGLAVGRMGIVAPVTAVLTAMTPALIGIMLEGAPAPVVIVGFGIAIVAVVVVSLVRDESSQRPTGLNYALIGGVTLGLLGVVLTRFELAHLFVPLAIMKGLEILLFLTFVAARRVPWRMPKATLPLAIVVGFVDIIGNVAFLTAGRIGELSIAAVLSSLYPVVTVILAATILRERITKLHAAGVGLAFVAIALIAGGTV